MGRVRVAAFSVSLDGFGAGSEQSLQDPLGKRGRELHNWFVGTKTVRAMFGKEGGSEGVDVGPDKEWPKDREQCEEDDDDQAKHHLAIGGHGSPEAPVVRGRV